MPDGSQFHVLLPTDAFPPVAGGSGWSTHALAKALQVRGHKVTAIVPRRAPPGIQRRDEQGVPVVEVGYYAPNLPIVQNYYRFELLWPLLRNVLVAESCREYELPVIIHAQHAQTAPAAVLAGRELEVPVIATIRDAWPWHYFATGLLADRVPFKHHNWSTDWLDLIGRLGPLRGVLAAPALPYMGQHLQRRAALLAQADAVIACSQYIKRKLEGIVPPERLYAIPHLVDVEATCVIAAKKPTQLPEEPFILFVGKLERNKGAQLLPTALETARTYGIEPPLLLIAGNGSLTSELRRELDARNLRYHLLDGWINHDAVLGLMQRAEVLLFPSAWGEPLSRVLLEGCAVGACIATIATGGTADAIVDGESGVLVQNEEALGQALAELLRDSTRREQLRNGAQRIARERFAASVVVEQVEQLYQTVANVRGVPGKH